MQKVYNVPAEPLDGSGPIPEGESPRIPIAGYEAGPDGNPPPEFSQPGREAGFGNPPHHDWVPGDDVFSGTFSGPGFAGPGSK